MESAQNGIGFWGLADLQVRGMSALGQKQTFRCFAAMSALPPKADIDPSASDVRFVPKADIISFDHLVGCLQEWLRDGEAKRLRGLEIDDEFVFGRLLNWKVTGFGTLRIRST